MWATLSDRLKRVRKYLSSWFAHHRQPFRSGVIGKSRSRQRGKGRALFQAITDALAKKIVQCGLTGKIAVAIGAG